MTIASPRYAAYYRVSTQKQGQSGLGLDAQRAVVRAYVARIPGAQVIAEFTEVESGKRSDRPEIRKAIAECKRSAATLVIAKLDRLARNVLFIATLMDSGVEFIACDMPQANRMTIHILAAVAENEAKAISDRTKAALAQARARGKKIGRRKGCKASPSSIEASRTRTRMMAMARDKEVIELLSALQKDGMTLAKMTAMLNMTGKVSARGGKFSKSQVHRILARNHAQKST